MSNTDDKPFTSDGCTGFPNLWFKNCCKDHDYAYWAGHNEHESDLNFLRCIAEKSSRLRAFAFVFAGFIVTGMALLRPSYRLYQKATGTFLVRRNKL